MIENIIIIIIGIVTLWLIVRRMYKLYTNIRHPKSDCHLCSGCPIKDSCTKENKTE